jgi:hypothetical protein
MWRAVATVSALVVLTISAQAAGDTKLEGLGKWFARPENEREQSYPFVRCAGLYMAALGYAGTKVLGQATADGYKESIVMLSYGAMVLRSKRTGGDPMDYEDQVTKDRNAIFQIYVDRMHANYAATGQAFMSDDLIKSDLTLCKYLTEQMAK